MSTAQPDLAGTRRVIFADSASATQDLRSRCLASMGGRADSVAAVPDLRDALAADPELSGIVLIAPIEALLEDVSNGQPVGKAIEQARATLNRLMYCLRQYHQRLMLIDLSHAPTELRGLAQALGLPHAALDGFSRGDADPVLRALAVQALAGDKVCRIALEFLGAKSAIPPDADPPTPADDTLGAYLALRQRASDGEALRAELSRREAPAKLADRQIRAMTREFSELGAKLKAATTRAEAAEERVSAVQAQLEQSEARAAEGAKREAELSQKVAILDARITSIRSTLSFRATKPIRRLGRSFAKRRHG